MKKLLAGLTVALLTIAFAPAALAQSEETGTVTVLHGVPGLTVDVYANGDLLIPGFEPGDQFGPADLPAADYDLEVRPAGAEADSDPAISGSATLPAGANATIVAHLDADGDPTLGVFVNDTSAIGPGEARVVARHTAAFGAVDILADGNAVFEGVTNGQEGAVDVPAGTYQVAITAAGDPGTEAFSASLTLEAGTSYLVHAIGDPAAGDFDVLVQTIDGLGTEVLGVAAGSGGLAAENGTATAGWLLALAAVAGLGLVAAVPAVAVVRRR
jgi:hypothetical protein